MTTLFDPNELITKEGLNQDGDIPRAVFLVCSKLKSCVRE